MMPGRGHEISPGREGIGTWGGAAPRQPDHKGGAGAFSPWRYGIRARGLPPPGPVGLPVAERAGRRPLFCGMWIRQGGNGDGADHAGVVTARTAGVMGQAATSLTQVAP